MDLAGAAQTDKAIIVAIAKHKNDFPEKVFMRASYGWRLSPSSRQMIDALQNAVCVAKVRASCPFLQTKTRG